MPAWAEAGVTMAVSLPSAAWGSGLFRVSLDGGAPALLTKIVDASRDESAHRWPQVLPGSQAVLLTVYDRTRDYDSSNIDVVSRKTGERKTIYRGRVYARYLPSGPCSFIRTRCLRHRLTSRA
jgi:hypothetical protein